MKRPPTDSTTIPYIDLAQRYEGRFGRSGAWPESRADALYDWMDALMRVMESLIEHAHPTLERRASAILDELGLEADDLDRPLMLAELNQVLLDFVALDHRDEFGQALAEVAVAQRAHLDPLARRLVEPIARSHLELFSVEATDTASARVVLRRMHDGRELTCHEMVSFVGLRPGEHVAARVVAIDGWRIAFSVVRVPRELAPELVEALARDAYWTPKISRSDYMKRQGAALLIRRLASEIRQVSRLATSCTGEGPLYLPERIEADSLLRLHAAFHTLCDVGQESAELDFAQDVFEGADRCGRLYRVERLGEEVTLWVFPDELAWQAHVDARFRDVDLRQWRVSLLPHGAAHPQDIAFLEQIGLRPRLHGVIETVKFGPHLVREELSTDDLEVVVTSCRSAARAMRTHLRRHAA